jgi:hypothetical protein
MRRGCGSLAVLRVERASLAVVGCWCCWEAGRVCWWADRCRRRLRRVGGCWSWFRRKVGLVGGAVRRWRENARVVARGSAWRLVLLVVEPFCSLVCPRIEYRNVSFAQFRLRSHPNLRAPQETPHRLRLSLVSISQFDLSTIHGGEIHVTLSRPSLINVSSQFATAFYNTFAKRNSERFAQFDTGLCSLSCSFRRCLCDHHLCWSIRVRRRF